MSLSDDIRRDVSGRPPKPSRSGASWWVSCGDFYGRLRTEIERMRIENAKPSPARDLIPQKANRRRAKFDTRTG